MGRFFSSQRVEENRVKHRQIDSNIPYAKAVKSIKWANRKGDEANAQPTLIKEGIICTNDTPNTQNEVLKRSLVGFLMRGL